MNTPGGKGARANAAPGPAPAPAALPSRFLPPQLAATAEEAARRDAFLLHGGLVDAWFQSRSDVLLVTFDNLSSVGERQPPQPWLLPLTERLGLSVLGIIASRKDWYRNDDTPALLGALQQAGFFKRFRRVVFTGASMGGYAALTFARLVPGAAVLAFSPQTSLNRRIAPFERRYPYGHRRWDWSSPAYLDAAEGVMPDDEVWLAYDPFVTEDRAHARRVQGAGVRHLALPHMGHRAIRMVKEIGALDGLVGAIAMGAPDLGALARTMRARRGALSWKRAMLAEAERRGHLRLALAAGRRLKALDPDDRFANRLVARLEGAGVAPAPVLDRLIRVDKGNPAPPFSGAIEHLHRALVLPERDGDQKLASGVLRADGTPAEMSRAWIRAHKSTPAPRLLPAEVITDLPGRHLFAGHFRGHFGHFLVESTARLWALDHLGVKLDSILYLPYRGDHRGTRRAIAGQRAFFDLLGIVTPVTSYPGTLRVEELYLPELGFGWLDRYAGSPAYRDFMCSRLSAAAPAEGGEKLYISRARLPALRGGILGETVIEENLARAGFEVFHPERHPLDVQIARYKAAREIVALDGSALHLAAYVIRPGARVTMVLRRSSANVADYLLQYRAFAGIVPAVVDAIRRDWVSGGATRADYRSVGEVDFAALFARLEALGHLPAGFSPDLPDEGEIAAMLAAQADRRGVPFRALGEGEVHPEAAEEDDEVAPA